MLPDIPVFNGITCTINTTEDCNLRCKYCYEINKCARSINPEYCYKFIDFLTDGDKLEKLLRPNETELRHGLIIDFIGGDSLIDPGLLDDVLTYLNYKNSLRDVPRRWRSSISSNGTLFYRKDVRDFCEKWKDNLSLGISIDGCPEIHDMNRVFPNGEGSMSKILEWWPWYREVFPTDSLQTKATCAKSSIPYLYDSLVFMHETLGLKYIHQNFIMENMNLEDEDLKLLDKQLEKCTQYVFDHRHEMHWSMIGPIFLPEEGKRDMSESMCGSGKMITLGIDGGYYPCFRWLRHTQAEGSKTLTFGNVNEGITNPEVYDIVYEGSKRCNCTKDDKCFDCEFEPCCKYCIGGCYAEFGEFRRTTYICEVTKLQCKWARIYKSMLKEKETDNASE